MTISLLYVVANLNVGGAEHHIAQIVPKLDRSIIHPTVFTIIGKGPLAIELERKGVTVIGSDDDSNWHKLNKIQRAVTLLQGATRLFFFLRKERQDIVHFFLPMPYLLGNIVSLLAGARVRVMSRRSLNNYQQKYRGLAKVEQWMHKRMSKILGNSEAVLENLRAEGVTEKQLGLIYNGVDIPIAIDKSERDTLRRKIGIDSQDSVISIVANLIRYKGHEDLLRGLAKVSPRLPENWKLVCVGNDSHGIMAELVELSMALGIAEHVKFIGGRDDVSSLLQASDVAVLSSHQEGFSNAVLEGMAAGLPMVVTNVGGNAEAVRDGIDGYVVPVSNPDALGEAISKILNNESLKKKMGKSGLHRVSDRFSVQACVKEYEKLYIDIVQ